jgi:cytochrome c-type biogenesis protein CcsB
MYCSTGTAPVLSMKSAISFFAWAIVGVYLIFQMRFRLMVLGSFIAPLVAILLIVSSSMQSIDVPVRPMFRSMWLTIHVITVFIGNALFAITFVSSIMYLIQEKQIKNKTLGAMYSRLPSLATLDSINYHSLIYGFPFLTIGMIAGAIYAQHALGTYWQWDPKEVWTLITWLLYAILLHERLMVGWQGRRAAIMSIICFMVLIFTFLGASLLLGGYHSFKNIQGGQPL